MPSDLTAQERAALVAEITRDRMEDWTFSYAAIPSRNVNHSGNTFAGKILLEDFYRIGGPLQVVPGPGSVSPEWVQATLPATGGAAGIVIVSAHLDSTAVESSPYEPLIDPAPGADDDASGIAGVLLAAQAMVTLETLAPASARKEIRFVLFNAEEAGRLGSKRYAEDALNASENIVGVFQMDMIGYAPSHPGPFAIFTGTDGDEGTPTYDLGARLQAMCPQVSPSLTATITPADGHNAGDTSDHVSFYPDFPACLVTEGEQNPSRHTAEDTPGKLNPGYAANIARAVAAAAWHMATR